jgi:uncharacterized membrane protein YdbT with pleckstrin-like domain
MSYVQAVLQPGEHVRAVGRLHWVIFLRAILLTAIALALIAVAPAVSPQIKDVIEIAAGVVLVLALVALLQAWFVRSITELAVTDHRVIYKRGFLRRHTVEMNMDKVETVDVDQSVLGRLLGFGSIRILGTGQGIENLRRVASPVQLRMAITARRPAGFSSPPWGEDHEALGRQRLR